MQEGELRLAQGFGFSLAGMGYPSSVEIAHKLTGAYVINASQCAEDGFGILALRDHAQALDLHSVANGGTSCGAAGRQSKQPGPVEEDW